MKARHKDTGEIIQLAEEGVISSDGRRFCWYQVELLPESIDEVQPSLSSDINKAAEEYANYNSQRWHEDGDVYYDHSKIVDAFKAGAEWMTGQEVYTYCIQSYNPISESPDKKPHCITLEYEENENAPYVRAGDRLFIQIRKKEE